MNVAIHHPEVILTGRVALVRDSRAVRRPGGLRGVRAACHVGQLPQHGPVRIPPSRPANPRRDPGRGSRTRSKPAIRPLSPAAPEGTRDATEPDCHDGREARQHSSHHSPSERFG